MNSMSTRMALALALLAPVLLIGLYLSGLLTLVLLALDIPLAWDTYPRYVRALGMPDMQPFANKIWLAGAFGFGLPVSAWVVGAFLLLRHVSHARAAPFAAPVQQTDTPAQSGKTETYYDQHLRAMAARSPRVPGTEEVDMKHAQAVAAAASLALAACATPSNSRLAQKAVPVTHSAETGTPAIANPAEELGQKLLKLIGGLQSKRDLNVERINAAFGIQMEERPQLPGGYEAQVKLNERWESWIRYEPPDRGDEARLSLSITPEQYGPLSMTSVCLDFEEFSEALKRLGYSREATRYRGGDPTGNWRFFRRKPDHEYTEIELISPTLFPLDGAGPVNISISDPEEEFIGKPAGGRRCIASIDVDGDGP